MSNTALVSMAQQFTGLPMESLIGAPLNAAANANASMAITQTKFILDTCFEKSTSENDDDNHQDSEYKPIMIKMSLVRSILQEQSQDDSGNTPPPTVEPFTTTFNLPLLTVIPINSLGVDSVDVTFEMEVKSSFSEEQTEEKTKEIQASASFEVKVGYGPVSATIKGNASYDNKDSSTHSTHYQKSNSAKYTVNVHAGQLPVPKGVNTIIEAYTNAIQPIQLDAPNNNNNN
jgi:hypothetical protein